MTRVPYSSFPPLFTAWGISPISYEADCARSPGVPQTGDRAPPRFQLARLTPSCYGSPFATLNGYSAWFMFVCYRFRALASFTRPLFDKVTQIKIKRRVSKVAPNTQPNISTPVIPVLPVVLLQELPSLGGHSLQQFVYLSTFSYVRTSPQSV